jgi:hypothetical protein
LAAQQQGNPSNGFGTAVTRNEAISRRWNADFNKVYSLPIL